MKIKLVPNINNQKLKIQSTDISKSIDIEETDSVGTLNYEKLRNLPKLNGKTLIGDVTEEDPTVGTIPTEDIIRILR